MKANMETEIRSSKDLLKDQSAIALGAQLLQQGELVVFPTETVYGIGANAFDPKAVQKIFEAKGRPQDNPLIVHLADPEELPYLVRDISPLAKQLAKAFWPGPLTMIFPKSDLVPAEVSAGLDTVAIRMPSHPVAIALIGQSGVPVAAPSANRSGSPSPTLAEHSYADLKGRVPLILDGGPTKVGLESTVVTLTGDTPKILRPGGITPEQIEEVVGRVALDQGVLKESSQGAPVLSPGMKYKHYAPKAEVFLIHGDCQSFAGYVNQKNQPGLWAMAFTEDLPFLTVPAVSYGAKENPIQQAQQLFAVLRQLDEKKASQVLVHAPSRQGVGLAVYNRLLRAASFREVRV